MASLETLRQMLDEGLVGAVYEAEQVARLDDKLGCSVPQIEFLGFTEFFAVVQRELTNTRVLQIAKLYDRPDPKFPSFSLPALLDFLETHADELPILERQSLIRKPVSLGGLPDSSTILSDSETTRALVATFRKHLPTGRIGESHPLDTALHATKTLRSKKVAHPELIAYGSLPRPTYEELDRLLRLAKELVATVTFAYFRVIDEDADGRFVAEVYAKRAVISLERLLVHAALGREVKAVG